MCVNSLIIYFIAILYEKLPYLWHYMSVDYTKRHFKTLLIGIIVFNMNLLQEYAK